MITRILRRFSQEQRENIAVGLAAGLAFGLAVGLAVGLANLSQLFSINPITIIIFIVSLFILTELFILIQTKIKNPTNWQVLGRKGLALLESGIVIVNGLNILWLIRNYLPKIDWMIVRNWIGYIGIGIISLALIIWIIYIWLQLNKKILSK